MNFDYKQTYKWYSFHKEVCNNNLHKFISDKNLSVTISKLKEDTWKKVNKILPDEFKLSTKEECRIMYKWNNKPNIYVIVYSVTYKPLIKE